MSEFRKRFVLDEYLLAPDQRLLTRRGEPVHLAKRPFEVLVYLIDHHDRFVSRNELLDLFWDGKDVYDDALRKCIGAIRKALDDQSDHARFIETRWGVGYRYIGPFEEQVVHEETVTEIQRTRGIRVVVEEEDVQTDSSFIDISPAGSAQALRQPSRRVRNSMMAATLAVLLVAIATIATLTYRSRRAPADSPVTSVQSVVVLPVKNMSGDPADEYLSDGITESLIASLARRPGFKVISRGSAFTFKGKNVDSRDVGRQLGVDAILEGSLRRSGGRVRIDVRLVSAADGSVLWEANTVESNLNDTFTLEDQLAREVATRLTKPGGGTSEQIVKRYTNNLDAYQAFLKGRYLLNTRTQENIQKGVSDLQQAIKLDPNYALAYAWLAQGYEMEYWFSLHGPRDDLAAKQRDAAERALSLDDSLPDAHLAVAIVRLHSLDLPGAASEQQRAIALNPGAAEAHHGYAYTLAQLGKGDEAVSEILRARELDPLNVVMNVDVGEILLYAGRYTEAIDALKHAVEMDPSRASAHYDLAVAYEHSGMEREAIDEYLKNEALMTGRADALKQAYTSSGFAGFWRKKFELTVESSKAAYVPPIIMARLSARVGDRDRAFDWLEKAYAERSPILADLRVDPALHSLHADPRYEQLLRRVGL